MAYSFTNSKGKTYFLHGKTINLKNGIQRMIFFFSSRVKTGALDVIPDGFEPMETQTGLPVLRKYE